ncbi:hypothetical protein [uncultured Clostridium sp.]|uniref:hypothetical protein n=1 Tax=uncultured Clostridium sp. TaxID=59620 RepID=UPI0026049078|nr:hypothetical protein [uncultured Clostridium sp.]
MGTDRRKQIIDAVQSVIEEEKCIGKKSWGRLKSEIDTYELRDGDSILWCSFLDFYKSGEENPTKKSIYIAEANKTDDDILELNIPYKYSDRYNGLVYEDDDIIEIRMYGKFKFKKRNYKAEIFMNFLKDNGYSNEVRQDDNSKEYVRLLNINKDLKLDLNTIKERFNKWLNVVNDYKEYNFLVQG